MTLMIDDPETEKLAQKLAQHTGESITLATRRAIEARLRAFDQQSIIAEKLIEIEDRINALPTLETSGADDIIGYDEHGLPC